MEQLGIVRKAFEDKAEVEVKRISTCGSDCGSCGGSCSAPNMTVLLNNGIGAKEGDLVEIIAKPRRILKYALIAYMIPFVMLVLGIVLGVNFFQSLGYKSYEMLGFVVGIVFLGISYILVKLIDNSIKKKDETVMEITRVL